MFVGVKYSVLCLLHIEGSFVFLSRKMRLRVRFVDQYEICQFLTLCGWEGRKRRNQQTWCNLHWVGLKLVKELTNVLKCLNRDLLRTNGVMC